MKRFNTSLPQELRINMDPDFELLKEDIESATEVYGLLLSGDFYKKQEEAEKWLRNRPGLRESIRESVSKLSKWE